MKLLTILALALTSTPALAYDEGTFRCKNVEGVPDNVYVIKTLSVGDEAIPFVEITRHYRSGVAGLISQTKVKGFASEFSTDGGNSSLSIGTLRIEFRDGGIVGCRQ